MANKAIDALTAAGTLDGSEQIHLKQGANSRRGTTQAIADLAWGTGGILGTPAQGDVIYFNGTTWVKLAAGTTGHFLKTQGAAANPVWAAATVTGSITSSGLTQNTGKLLGRTTASSGAVEEITPSTGLSMASGAIKAKGYQVRRLHCGVPGSATSVNVNSTSYISLSAFRIAFDLDEYPFSHYRIRLLGQSNAAGQTITIQLAQPGFVNPAHTGGDDISGIPNTFTNYDSGWLSRDDGLTTGINEYVVQLKGSNSTVDLQIDWIEVHTKLA